MSERTEQLALNLFDLDNVHKIVRESLLSGKVDVTRAIKIDKSRPDEVAVLLTCDLLSAACICDTLRTQNRKHDETPIRVYLKRETAWSKVPYDRELSLVEGDRCRLNPEVFPQIAEVSSLSPKEVSLGMELL